MYPSERRRTPWPAVFSPLVASQYSPSGNQTRISSPNSGHTAVRVRRRINCDTEFPFLTPGSCLIYPRTPSFGRVSCIPSKSCLRFRQTLSPQRLCGCPRRRDCVCGWSYASEIVTIDTDPDGILQHTRPSVVCRRTCAQFGAFPTKRDQVDLFVVTKCATSSHVVNVEILRASTFLTAPTITLQDWLFASIDSISEEMSECITQSFHVIWLIIWPRTQAATLSTKLMV